MAGYFAIFLVVLTLACGLIWLLDKFVLAPKRQQQFATAQTAAGGQLSVEVAETVLKEPQLVETAKSIFPVLALITIFNISTLSCIAISSIIHSIRTGIKNWYHIS